MDDVTVITKRQLSDYDTENVASGSFGSVYPAVWRVGKCSRKVAVKVFKADYNQGEFEQEVEAMANLSHPNVVELLGITETRPPCIVMEFVEFGDLKRRLLTGGLPGSVMIKVAYGIANGMKYLHHGIFPYRTHKDLAARNCLVGPNWTTKIADIGFWKAGYAGDYFDYNSNARPCPLRWMAPECVPETTYYDSFTAPVFTRKNDVWAYGVVLFEIWGRGATPFGAIDDNYEVIQALTRGENPRTYKNVDARAHIVSLMVDCWDEEPSERPNFKQIVSRLEDHEPSYAYN